MFKHLVGGSYKIVDFLSKGYQKYKKIVDRKTKIIRIAKEVLVIERDTLNGLKDSIGLDFAHCVEAIIQSKGRLVVTGIGKSALVAKKVVATLNSTGTPSLFMHAADAIHGDIGMIQKDDIILCISKSGETSEIKVLVPILRSTGHTLIGMVAHQESYLAKHADYLLLTPISKEADPNNLAPTASTTAQMAMGDALATALLALRGFTPLDFAQFHPGGMLGKQLYLRVSAIFVNNERPVIYETDTIRKAILEMTSKRLGMVVVLDKSEKIAGIITDGDLRRMLENQRDITNLKAKDIMTTNPKVIEAEVLAVKALEIMRNHSITQLIVAEGDKYLGVVHLHDLIREGLI